MHSIFFRFLLHKNPKSTDHMLRAAVVSLNDVLVFLSADQLAPLSAEQELQPAAAREAADASPELAVLDLTVRAAAYRVRLGPVTSINQSEGRRNQASNPSISVFRSYECKPLCR